MAETEVGMRTTATVEPQRPWHLTASSASRLACTWRSAWSRFARPSRSFTTFPGEFLEDLVCDAFTGRQTFSDAGLAQAAELMRIYGLDSMPGAQAEERS